jgi:hypothetical protein
MQHVSQARTVTHAVATRRAVPHFKKTKNPTTFLDPTMQIKTLAIFALAVACASAENENATYIGCYYDCQSGGVCGDAATSYRDLPVFFCSNGKNPNDIGACDADPSGMVAWAGGLVMAPQLCSDLCHGFKFFGVQFSNCFCGNDYGNQGGKVPESDCNAPCPGDPAIMCGSKGSFNSIYAQPPSMYNATASSH